MNLFSNDISTNLLPCDGMVHYFGKIMSDAEALDFFNRLLSNIEWRNDEAVIYGKHYVTKRKVAWYGDKPFSYSYSNTTKEALPWTAELHTLKTLAEKLSAKFPMEVVVAGRVDDATQRKLQSKVSVKFLDTIPREKIPHLIRSSHLMYSAEVNPPCPNAVIEALACGLPVVGFDSGSLKELVTGDAGRIVPYGGNPWKLETPDISALAVAAEAVLTKQDQFRAAARKRAESAFG